MANLTVTVCRPVKVDEQFTAPADAAIAVGTVARFDTTTGLLTPANGSSAAEARARGVCVSAAGVGITGTIVTKGILDLGAALDSLTHDDDVFLSDTDGTLADSAGTVSTIIGTTVPGFGTTTPDKLLRVNL